jgi:RNA polymerase sigma-70 factor (ECF subfamily)
LGFWRAVQFNICTVPKWSRVTIRIPVEGTVPGASSFGDVTVLMPSRLTSPAASLSAIPDAHAAFAAVALPLLPVVARVAFALTRDQSEAEDLVQDTYLRAFRKWESFEPGTDCRRWLLTVCRNAFRDRYRRERSTDVVADVELESIAAAQLHNAARDAGVADLYSRVDLGPAISRAIAALDPIFREVVVLCDVEGFSYEEAADTLGVPIGTVRSRLYRGRRTLQQALMNYAIDAGFGRRPSGE